MRRLILLRHAKAVPRGQAGDHERDLAPRGRADAAWAGQTIAQARWRPEVALVSDARRTRTTFDLAVTALTPAPALHLSPDLYDADPEQVLAAVAAAPATARSLLVIGHNPSLSLVAIGLAAADAAARHGLRQGLPTAAMAVFTLAIDGWARIGTATGSLDALLTPP